MFENLFDFGAGITGNDQICAVGEKGVFVAQIVGYFIFEAL